jgi:hypothetical protein
MELNVLLTRIAQKELALVLLGIYRLETTRLV